MVEKEMLPPTKSGLEMYDFDPADGHEDSEVVNDGVQLFRQLRGLTVDSALAGRQKREASTLKACRYQEFVPCVKCANCVIVRVSEHGEFKNRVYMCALNRVLVSRYGTCTMHKGEHVGPTVLQFDATMEEILANKANLIN